MYHIILPCCLLLLYCSPSNTQERTTLAGIELTGKASTLYTSEQIATLKEILVEHPQDLLADHNRILHDVRKTNTLTQAFIDTNQQAYPLFMLFECIWLEEDFDDPEKNLECELSRLAHPHYRNTFEHHVVTAIEEAHKKSDKEINYVNVGAGGLFQDLVIVTQVLEKNIKKLNIHLIDPTYDHYIQALNRTNPSCLMYHTSENYDFEEIAAQIDFDHQELLVNYLTIHHIMFKQFIAWFKTAFPNAEVHIFIYDSVKCYLSDCQQKPEIKADILFQCDPDPEGYKNQGIHFIYALAFGLKKGGIALDLGKERVIMILQKNFDSQLKFFVDEDEFNDYYGQDEPMAQFESEMRLILETKKAIKLENKQNALVHDEL